MPMASTCISNYINDTQIPLRRRYVNINRWRESNGEFPRPASTNVGWGVPGHPRVVDSISCRQMFLRSYRFSRKESVHAKTKKYFGKVKERVKNRGSSRNKNRRSKGSENSHNNRGFGIKRKWYLRRAKQVSCDALSSMFRRLLSCTAKVDVVDPRSEIN